MNLRTSVYMIWGLRESNPSSGNPGTDYPKRHRGSTFSYMLREHPFPGLKGKEVCSLCAIMLMSSYYVTWVLELNCIWLFPYYTLGRLFLRHTVPIPTKPLLYHDSGNMSPLEFWRDTDCWFFETKRGAQLQPNSTLLGTLCNNSITSEHSTVCEGAVFLQY